MANRVSRAPVIPLTDINKAISGELCLQFDESIPKLVVRMENGQVVDLIEANLMPVFNNFAEEFRQKHVSATIQNYTPTNNEAIWMKSTVLEDALDPDEQL